MRESNIIVCQLKTERKQRDDMKMDVEVGVYLGGVKERRDGQYDQNTSHEILKELLQIIFKKRGARE